MKVISAQFLFSFSQKIAKECKSVLIKQKLNLEILNKLMQFCKTKCRMFLSQLFLLKLEI